MGKNQIFSSLILFLNSKFLFAVFVTLARLSAEAAESPQVTEHSQHRCCVPKFTRLLSKNAEHKLQWAVVNYAKCTQHLAMFQISHAVHVHISVSVLLKPCYKCKHLQLISIRSIAVVSNFVQHIILSEELQSYFFLFHLCDYGEVGCIRFRRE